MPEKEGSNNKNMFVAHVAAECLVAMGIVYYVMANNKVLTKNIEILNRKVSELDSRTQQQDQILKYCVNNVEQMKQLIQPPTQSRSPQQPRPEQQHIPVQQTRASHQPTPMPTYAPVQTKRLPVINELNETFETESNLDRELADELDELKTENENNIKNVEKSTDDILSIHGDDLSDDD